MDETPKQTPKQTPERRRLRAKLHQMLLDNKITNDDYFDLLINQLLDKNNGRNAETNA